jgi:structure-specific endonuclease subunit SLX1
MSLTVRLGNLQLLLNAASFRRWPLRVTFYAKDVFKLWQQATKHHIGTLRSDLVVDLYEPISETPGASVNMAVAIEPTIAPSVNAGIYALSVDYSSMKARLEESMAVFALNEPWLCEICNNPVPSSGSATLVCPGNDCLAVTHVQCMSTHFLATQGTPGAVIPTQGHCPKCNTSLQWVDLVKELTLRMRGGKEIAALFKPKRGKKPTEEVVDSEDEVDEPDEDALEMVLGLQENEWQALSESSEDDSEQHDLPLASLLQRKHASFKKPLRDVPEVEAVIDDSDWNDAEIIT